MALLRGYPVSSLGVWIRGSSGVRDLSCVQNHRPPAPAKSDEDRIQQLEEDLSSLNRQMWYNGPPPWHMRVQAAGRRSLGASACLWTRSPPFSTVKRPAFAVRRTRLKSPGIGRTAPSRPT